MRYLLVCVLCLTWCLPCHASSCRDMQDSVATAIQHRTARTTSIYNTMIPDPESEREVLSGCLDTVNTIGDAFTLGISLPGMDQILQGMCDQVDSLIQEKIDQAHNKVLSSIDRIGDTNVFKVYGTGEDYIVHTTDRLQ